MLHSRFERINFKEREKDRYEKTLNAQLMGTFRKYCQYGCQSDSQKYLENHGTDENKNPSRRNSKRDLNESWCLNTRCWNCGKLGHETWDCLESERQTKQESVFESSTSNEELDLVLCTMDDIIIELLIQESISSANGVAEMQDKHLVKQVRFVDEVEKTNK